MIETTADTMNGVQGTSFFAWNGGWRRVSSRIMLAVLPLVFALVGYYRAQLSGEPLPRPRGDAAFYAYQFQRAAECHGRWWRIADDPRLGHPYPSEFAKHPGLFEGIDLMLLATLFGGVSSAAWTYHLAVMAALIVNGWIAAWMVLRTTRSTLWAAVAVALVTLNESVAIRILVHLHLFKFGWVLLCVWAFAAFRKVPTWRRGLTLGLAVALVLQSSFYLGFFTVLGLGFWYCVEAAVGPARPGLWAAAIVALFTFTLAAAPVCLPVWNSYSPIVGSDQYFQRYWAETWIYGSELWKYAIPKNSVLAENYFRDLRHKVPAPVMDEGWNFPGYTVLLAVVIVGASWLRGSDLTRKLPPVVIVGLGLMAFWMIVSLAGGPSALIFHAIPSFRCYGRAGLLVVALGSVVAPIVAHELVRSFRRPSMRMAVTLAVLVLVASDAGRAAATFRGWPVESKPPDWAEWLNREPGDVRLAVFTTHPPTPVSPSDAHGDNEPFYWWGIHALEWLPLHQHATSGGGNFTLFEGDLRLLGASYDRINPAGLRFVASLGYEAFAFHHDYLAANSWITSCPWLERVDHRGEWSVYRSNSALSRFPTTSLDSILVENGEHSRTIAAPAGCWITGSWPVRRDTIVAGNDWALLAWTDEQGRFISQPQPALYQHVFGPDLAAYTIRTPSRPGSYRLAVLDRHRRPRAMIRYQIDANIAVSQPTFPARRPALTVHPVVLPAASAAARVSSWQVTLANTSKVYVQSQVFRQHMGAATQTHPGLRSPWLRACDGGLVLSFSPTGGRSGACDAAREILLPRDLAPGDLLTITIPPDRLPSDWAERPLRVELTFSGVGGVEVAAAKADLKLSIDERPAPLASKHSATDGRAR